MPGFTVDATGFTVPRYAEARTRIVELWREEFGPNTDTSPASTDGQMITIAALLLTLAWQGVGASIANGTLRTSEGGYVDLILDLFARRRLDAEASTASLVWYGTDTTVVPLGALAARQRRRVEGDVADQIEGVVVAADLRRQFFQEHALARQLVEDGLLAHRVVPDGEEIVQ